ncbi:MAG TPA: hypothetical protein PKE21_04610 [Flavobacteriales bacterium]|nr:hypothetical protein [Flavobacteriales bacterium]HMR26740.1 hypothetical protein [Flavobacteriales bacterium]
MNEHPSLIDTATATVERVSAALIEVRFKPDVKLDVEGIGEVVNAKRTLCGADSPDVLAVMPPEVDFELNVLNVDHSKANGGCPTRRLAFAGQSPLNERLANLYFSYFPRHSETRVFHDEREARLWLDQRAEVVMLP